MEERVSKSAVILDGLLKRYKLHSLDSRWCQFCSGPFSERLIPPVMGSIVSLPTLQKMKKDNTGILVIQNVNFLEIQS